MIDRKRKMLPKSKPTTMKTYPMTVEVMDGKLEAGQARIIETIEYARIDNPVIAALTELDREIWKRVGQGLSNNMICKDLSLRVDQCSRMIQAIRSKIIYVVRLRELLREDKESFIKWVGLDKWNKWSSEE